MNAVAALPASILPPNLPGGGSPRTLARCLALAFAVHVLLVVMLGNVPGGSAKFGEGVWGAINVTLRGAGGGEGSATKAPAARPTAAPTGTALAPVPSLAAPSAATPAEAAPTLPSPALPAPTQVPEPGLTLDPIAPISRASALSAPLTPLAPLGPATLPALPQSPTATPDAGPVAAEPERALAPTVPRAAVLPSPQAPIERTTPIAMPQALPRIGELSPPPAEAVAAPAERALATTLPAPSRPLESSAPLASTPAAPALSSLPAAPEISAQPAASIAPAAPAAAGGPASPAAPTAGDTGPRVGLDGTSPQGQPSAAAPPLDLRLPRPRAGEISGAPSRGVLPLLPRPPEIESKLARDIERSAKDDCRKAYSGLGVLAVVPLAVDAVRAGGCKW